MNIAISNTNVSKPAFSETCHFLTFILTLFVVLFHCRFDDIYGEGESISYHLVETFVSKVMEPIRVPTFFCISGYFFFKGNIFNKNAYASKLKKRCSTLLIPYLIWNSICLLLQISRSNNLSEILTFRVITESYFGANFMGFPVNVPMWYIRELLYMSIISPIIYLGIKRLGKYFIGVAILLYIALPNFTTSALLFFSIGAYARIKNHNIFSIQGKHKSIFTIASIIIATGLFLLNYNGISGGKGVFLLALSFSLIGIPFVFTLAANIPAIYSIQWSALKSFGVFCYFSHGTFIGAIKLRIIRLMDFMNHGSDWLLLAYIVSFILTVGVCFIMYWSLSKTLPGCLKILIGNR